MGAFAKVLELISKEKNPVTPGIHATAIVSSSATLGKNVYIGPYAVIEDQVSVGNGACIGAHGLALDGAAMATRRHGVENHIVHSLDSMPRKLGRSRRWLRPASPRPATL